MFKVVLKTQGITEPDDVILTETASKLYFIEIGDVAVTFVTAVNDSWLAACSLPFYNYFSA